MTFSTRSLMPIDDIDDWEQRLARQDAFWDCAVVDRPVVCMTLRKEKPRRSWPANRTYATVRDRWMDTGRIVEQAVAHAANTEFLGDALPVAWPNLGPEIFSAFFGAELEYSPDSAWAVPNLRDWRDVALLRPSRENFYWKKLLEMTGALLEAGKGRYYTGLTDFHPGADAIAAFRDPLRLNLDLLEHPHEVKRLLATVTEAYFETYDFYYDKLTGAGQAITSWPGIVSTRKWYVPSNDFSCMISDAMFLEFFYQGIIEECRHYEAGIYHLDGPNALRFLDPILEIKELNAIQWVYGAGHGRASDWLHVYQRCQGAGKGVQLFLELDELDAVMENLRPEGVWIHLSGVPDRPAAEDILRRVTRWR